MSRAITAFVLSAALCAAVWWWLPQDPDGAATARAASPAPMQTAAVTERGTERVEAPAEVEPSTVRQRSELAPPPPPPEPQGIEDGAPAAPVQGDFSWKYQHFDPRALEAQLQELERELQRELDGAIVSRLAEGRFIEHRVKRDERRGVMEVLAEHAKDDPLCRAWPVFDPADASNPTAQQTLIAVRVVCLERNEHAALATLADECAWLRARAGRR